MVVTATCPACHDEVRRWIHIPFVYFRTRCACGAPLMIQNPQLDETYIRQARRCLDCGDPIAPPVAGGRNLKYPSERARPHPWVCQSCWERHRHDEPGTNIDVEIQLWLKGQKPQSRSVPSRRP